jgi:monovalent cation:proton antiporter-2 (CPA2) family protein
MDTTHDFLGQAFVYLAAAMVMVPVSKRLGLGSVLGYLLAGLFIGPFGFALVTPGGTDVMHYGEVSVITMLFLIGLELDPKRLWRMRAQIFGMGGSQVAAVTAVGCIVGMGAGLPWHTALAVGMAAAMSSTAIVLQTLREKGLLRTQPGQCSFSVLLFQDIAVIPILAILPLLAIHETRTSGGHDISGSLPAIAQLGPQTKALFTVAAVAVIVIVGRWLSRAIFRFIARAGLREVFTAAALAIVVGTVLLMDYVELSRALGAFVAGVVLANSEYRHQLEVDLEPFKGLLLGLFFVSVGASLDVRLIQSEWRLELILVAILLAIKVVVHAGVAWLFKMRFKDACLFSLGLAQGGEFAFVLFSQADRAGVVPGELVGVLNSAVALSMATAPLLFLVYERVIAPRAAPARPEREPDEIDEHDNPVILAGFGRFGNVVGRLLINSGVRVTVLDNDDEQVELLRKFGLKTFYGDATRVEFLRTAGAGQAKLIILTLASEEGSLKLVREIREHFPQARILARAHSRQHARALIREGVADVYRDTLGTALDMGVDALRALGFRGLQATRAAQLFKKHDEAAVLETAMVNEDTPEYISATRQHLENLRNVLNADSEEYQKERRNGWHEEDDESAGGKQPSV